MSETIRDVTLRLKIEIPPDSLKMPSFDSAAAEVEKLKVEINETVTLLSQKLSQTFTNVTNTVVNNSTQVINKIEEVKDHTIDLEKQQVKLAESYHKVAEGAIKLTQGFALIGVASSETAERMVKNIATIKGFADMARGAIDISKGLVEAKEALTAITTINTAANVANTASVTAGATAQAALLALMNPWVAVAATVALAIYGIIDMWNSHNAAVDAVRDRLQQLQNEFDRVGSAMASAITTRHGFDQQLLQMQSVAEQLRTLGQLAAEYQDKLTNPAHINVHMANLDALKSVTMDMAAAQEKDLANKEQSLRLSQQELTTAKQLLSTEQDRLRNIDASLGRLGAEERGELSRLIGLAEQGQLSADQAGRLGQLGGTAGQEIATQQLAALGSTFQDRDRLLALAGMPDRTGDLQSQVNAIENSSGGEAAITAKLQELAEKREEYLRRNNELLTEIINRQIVANDKLRELQADSVMAQAAGGV